MAFPVAFAISIVFHYTLDTTIISVEESEKLLKGTHPFKSGMIVYAAVAGVFLFLSALIGGWVDNRNLYVKFPERIANHPYLVKNSRSQKSKTILQTLFGQKTGNHHR